MSHILDEELLAYLDGELDPARRPAVAGHLDECDACAGRHEALCASSQALSQALAAIDLPAPAIDAETVLAGRPHWIRRLAVGSLLKAAVLVLVIGGLGSAAVPGSPVRDWLSGLWSGATDVLGLSDEPQAPPAVTDMSSVAVAPSAGRVRISLEDPAPEAEVRVLLVDGGQAAVWSASARFRTGPGWIEVLGAGPGELRVDLPRWVDSARVEVNGRLVVLKEGSALRLVSAGDSVGPELRFRVGE